MAASAGDADAVDSAKPPGAGALLGVGTLGSVYEFGAAAIKVYDAKRRHRFAIENTALYMLKGQPNVVQIIDAGHPPKSKFLYITLERARNEICYPGRLLRDDMRQMLRALSQCHENGVIHGDVQFSNFMEFDNDMIKIIDFSHAVFTTEGVAVVIPGENYPFELRPPELLSGMTVMTPSADIWALGSMFAWLATGDVLFPSDNEANQLGAIFEILGTPTAETWPEWRNKKGYPARPNILRAKLAAAKVDPGTIDILSRMLVCNPAGRISARDALALPYFTD